LQSFETICYGRVMRIPWTDKRRNEDILEQVGGRKLWNSLVARKLRYLGHIMRKEDDNLEKRITTGMVEGTRGRGRPRRAWSDNIKEWTNLTTEEIGPTAVDEGSCSLEECVVNRVANVCASE